MIIGAVLRSVGDSEPLASLVSLPEYPLTPMWFVLSAVGLVIIAIALEPQRAGIGLAMALPGLPHTTDRRGSI